MKIVILCGGYGSRLAGAGAEVPKPMVPIGGRPIVWHIMSGFAAAGFRDFILALGYRSDVFKQYFMNLSWMLGDITVDFSKRTGPVMHRCPFERDWRITLAETGYDDMTGSRVRQAMEYLDEGDDIFGVTYGDGVTDLDFRDVVDFHRSHGRLATVTAVHPPARFGELSLVDGGRVGEFNEKPQAAGGWISGGFFVFSRRIRDYLAEDPKLVLERDPLQQIARDGELMAYRHDGFWYCMDTPRDYQQLQELWNGQHAPWATWQHQ